MKIYIDFKKNFFKLIINSFYDKTIENWGKRINARIVSIKKDFLKDTSRPANITHEIFDKNYAATYEIKPVLTLNKPIYLQLENCGKLIMKRNRIKETGNQKFVLLIKRILVKVSILFF